MMGGAPTQMGAGSKYGVRYGWKPGLPDFRDYHLSLQHIFLPDEFDNSIRVPQIWNQLQLGACVGFGTTKAAAVAESHEAAPNPAVLDPSQLFVYFNGRVIEGTVEYDSGLSVADGMKAIAKSGICSAADWPYDISRYTDRPPAQAYADAKTERGRRYYRVPQTLDSIKSVLASGYAIAFGMVVYESFESLAVETTGIVPIPQAHESRLGGHCMCVLGYKESRHWCVVPNSWGTSWGGKNEVTGTRGYAFIPYEIMLNPNLVSDLWMMKLVD